VIRAKWTHPHMLFADSQCAVYKSRTNTYPKTADEVPIAEQMRSKVWLSVTFGIFLHLFLFAFRASSFDATTRISTTLENSRRIVLTRHFPHRKINRAFSDL
jgi:hypothetical protein